MTVRWGLLGTAHVNRRLIPAMRAARRSVVSAIASRDPARSQHAAAEWQIPTAHASYDALLHDQAIDAIYVPLPNALHVEWTLRALDAGKHVLCEKPLALSSEDVDRIAAVARARERVVAEAFMYRHEPLIHRVLDLVRAGAVGRLTYIASVFTFEQSRAGDIRLVPALGGGSLWDVGCYATSAIRLIAAHEPSDAFGWARSAPSGVDDSFAGMLRFASGVVGVLHCSFREPYRTELQVHGAAGRLRVTNPFKPGPREEIELQRGDEVARIAVEGSSLPFVRLVEDFAAAVLDGRAPTITLQESRGNAATLSALHAAARDGRPVTI